MSRCFHFGTKKSSPTAKSVQRRKRAGAGLLLFFGLVFALGGALGIWFFTVQTWLRIHDSKAWAEVPVVIIESKVASRSTSDGVNYLPQITYSYEMDGRRYQGNTWRLIEVSSSSRSWARGVVDAYPVGSTQAGWVNPQDPEDAVLEQKLGAWVMLTFIPVVFCLIGLALTGFGIKQRRQRTARELVRSGDSLAENALRDGKLLGLPDFPDEPDTGIPVALSPRHGPLGRLAGLGLVALFWSGITWTLLGLLIADARDGGGYEWVPVIFLSFFALIGAVMLVAFLYTLLGFFLGPRVRFTAVSSVLKPGEDWEMSWQFTRGSGRVRELRITLVGQTEADYTRRRGRNSNRVTDTKVFLRQTFLVSVDPEEIARGSARVGIPGDLPHSFEGANNRIRYHLTFVAAVSLMPNLNEEYPVYVPPITAPASYPS